MRIDKTSNAVAGTLGSRYDNNSVVVYLNKRAFRMRASEISKLLIGKDFTMKKARVHTYLELDEETSHQLPYMVLHDEDLIEAGYPKEKITPNLLEKLSRNMGESFSGEFNDWLKAVKSQVI